MRSLYNLFQMQQAQEQKIHYKEHKALFEKIKEEDRPAWIQKMLEIQQKKGDYPLYKKDYPTHGKWTYKECEHHYYSYINPSQPTKAVLFYFPGLNVHANGSAYFTMGIAQKCPIDIYALDYKNFGRSAGTDRGHISSAEEIIDQAENFIDFIMTQQKDKKKIYISGLSLGGAVCFKLALRHPERYAGVIFLSPAIKQNKEASPFMKKVGKLIGSWFPNLKLISQTFNNATKYDQTQRIMADPYVYKDKVIPGTIKVVLDLMEETEKQFSKFSTPFILVQSGVDKMVDPFLGIDLERQCKSQDKTVVYWKEMWHAVFAEDELPEVIEAVTEWMGARVGK